MHLFRTNDTVTRSCLLNTTDNTDAFRVALVGIVGSIVALISFIENILLFYVFSTSRKLRRQNYANPVLLAFFDTVVSVCYMLTVCVPVMAYTAHSQEWIRLWANYMRITYVIKHFALTVSNFLLVVASLERYLANGPILKQSFQKRLLVIIVGNKALVIFFIFFFAFLFKATLYFETDLLEIDCHPVEQIHPIWLDEVEIGAALDWPVWRFWIRKVFTIILPFLILAFCNAHIVLHLRRKRRKSERQHFTGPPPTIGVTVTRYPLKKKLRTSQRTVSQSESTRSFKSRGSYIMKQRYSEKRGVRVATRTLVMVVGCYLISNSVSTIINIWEYLDSTFFRYDHYYFYLVASDLAGLLTICGCALRLPIYVINDHRIRNALYRAFLRLRYCYRKPDLSDFDNGNLEKWSIVIVSNSLRSNVTGIPVTQEKKSLDQLAMLVQNRGKFLVQMTVNLGNGRAIHVDDGSLDYTTFLTDIVEEQLELTGEARRLLEPSNEVPQIRELSVSRRSSYRSKHNISDIKPTDIEDDRQT
ncbi:unnamed protein product [Bursaphelenchus okinawaensis]|uniref:G-protein coupled receptors family 1 profile domain-containing protein n=1 Tax=Bursaphelenchus okinawaensis TaxID=465554 RepID=A0A811L4J2_9BILA|nr:unnamed protein product [Bursaphelenchus okinawaensis]CAG9119550.1 unnamed protein product [Bursaphelenchus okinawaensis]